jgi:hypothetical protein
MATDPHHRDKNGEIGRKLGNTLIRTRRKTYGAQLPTAAATTRG